MDRDRGYGCGYGIGLKRTAGATRAAVGIGVEQSVKLRKCERQ